MLHACPSIVLAALPLFPGPLVQQPGHPISGRVLDHDGQPVAGARLWISSQAEVPQGPTWELVASATSMESGEFELTLPPDWIERSGILCDLSVLVWKQGHGAFQASWAPDEVPAGIPFEPWLPEPRATEFTVEDRSGEPYRGARVYPTALTYPDTGGGLRIAPEVWLGGGLFRTDEEGHVTLPFAPETMVELSVAPQHGGSFSLTWTDRSAGDFPRTLVLPRPEDTPIEVEAPLGSGTRVSLRAWLQVPSFEARTLQAEFKDELELEGDGPFTARVPPHLGQLRVTGNGEGARALNLAATKPGPAGWIHGVARNEDGTAAAGAWITAARAGQERHFRVLTAVAGPDGSFRLGPAALDDPMELRGHLEGRVARTSASALGEAAATEPVELTLSPALLARVDSTWTGSDPAPRLRLTLVGSEAQKFLNVGGALIAGGKLHLPSEVLRTAVFERALEPRGFYAIRFEGWSESERRRIEPGMTAFLPAEDLAAGITIEPLERWTTAELSAWDVDVEPKDTLRVRLRTSPFWSPVASDGRFTVIGGESTRDILLFERNGVIEGTSLRQSLRSAVGPMADFETRDQPHTLLARSRDADADALLVKRIAWPRVEASLGDELHVVLRWLKPLMHADPDGVLAFLESGAAEDPALESLALSMLTERLAIEQPERALSLVGRQGMAHRRFYIAYLTAPNLEKPVAMQELSRALAELPGPTGGSSAGDNLLRIALIARGFLELGEHQAALEAIVPVIETAREAAKTDKRAFEAGELGAAVFLLDREVGLELIQSAKQNSDRHRSMARAAAWLSKVDADASEEMLKELKGSYVQFYIDRALPGIVYHLAGDDAPRATAIADAYGTSGMPYGLIALALWERGARKEAIEALQQAFDRVDADAATGAVRRHHPVAVAAFLLGIADVVDPEGFERWQRRALGVPRFSGGVTSMDVESLAGAEACLAIALSERSGQLARAVLEPWIAAVGTNGPRQEGARRQIRTIGAALALIHREGLEAELEQLPKEFRDPALRAGLAALARSSEPLGRVFAACDLLPASWWPGEEGL